MKKKEKQWLVAIRGVGVYKFPSEKIRDDFIEESRKKYPEIDVAKNVNAGERKDFRCMKCNEMKTETAYKKRYLGVDCAVCKSCAGKNAKKFERC
jgi:formylmethanofuran dehydrogenase subunit E